MASKFVRGAKWWIKCRHPATGQTIRESLETSDEARAELLRQRITLEVELLEPRFQVAQIPDRLRAALELKAARDAATGRCVHVKRAEIPVISTQRTPIDEALRVYYKFIRSANVKLHVANKVSILRRFFGSELVEPVIRKLESAELKKLQRPKTQPFFHGRYLDQITPGLVQEFIERPSPKKLEPRTRRHYRELFHHFFEICLKFDLYHPTNWYRPNPICALPSYLCRNQRIVFLSSTEIEEQLGALHEHPEIHMAVAILIHAGTRRNEALWLKKTSIAPDLSFLSVLNRLDNEEESSLKTGQRPVTILPPLQQLLQQYQPPVQSDWIIPNSKGRRWRADNFSKKLSDLNHAAKLPWTCHHFRHTYATQRAAEGWPLFRIAKEMGTSCAMVEQHYAAFVRPG